MLPAIPEFSDPRLVAIYDIVNPYRPDAQPGFYSQLAAELGATSIVDLGCGTGLVTCALAEEGYRMTGFDPAPEMLEVARRRDHDRAVTWIEGGAERLGTPGADLAVMTGHVAQFFLTDESWMAALGALHASLRPGGHLAFESRNPRAREWEGWTAGRRRRVRDPVAGPVEVRCVLDEIRDGVVSATGHYRFVVTGEELVSPHRLRFRSEAEIEASLAAAGFELERVYGDWDRSPVVFACPELIVVARR